MSEPIELVMSSRRNLARALAWLARHPEDLPHAGLTTDQLAAKIGVSYEAASDARVIIRQNRREAPHV